MSQEINLLHAVSIERRRSLTSAAAMVYGVLAAAALTLALAVYEHSQLPALKNDAKAAERALKQAQLGQGKTMAERNARKPDPNDDVNFAQLEAQLRSRLEVADALSGGVVGTAVGFSRYMMALSRQSLPGVWLTGFDLAAGGMELTLSGRALNADLLPAYLQRLTREAPLQSRRFTSMLISQPGTIEAAKGGQGDGTAARKAAPYVEFVISSAKPEEATEKSASPAEGVR